MMESGTAETLPSKRVVLLGIGHTNAHVLRMWKMRPIDDTDLICLSNYSVATYSGMLPAVLAGQVPAEQMEIDLVRLCASVGATLITDPVVGLDRAARTIQFADRPKINFDVLSIGIGSTAASSGVEVEGDSLIKIKPMQTFLQRLSEAVDAAVKRRPEGPLRVVIVGSGVAGIEITFCIPAFVKAHSGHDLQLQLVTRSEMVLPEVLPKTRSLVNETLSKRGVIVSAGRAVQRVTADSVILDNGESIDADLVVWSTGATAPDLLSKLGLPVDDRGFLLTENSLRCVSAEPIFAVGDTGTIEAEGLPKAGVYAVRQGPVLWENIQRSLSGATMQNYRPQRSFLKLINQGDGSAIGQWKRFSFSGRWVMRLKHSIDNGFMEMFRVQPMTSVAGDENADEMQCRGCGCKLGADVLQAALPSAGDLAFDDAAEIGRDGSKRLVASTDFFSSPVPDPYLAGRIAALHSASDIIASGATVTRALSNIVVPEGDPKAQQQALQDLLAGARKEFSDLGASIVGGHTIVGPRMELGFTVIGESIGESLIEKRNLRVGDQLLLTKPIGSGVLMAAHMRGLCPAREYERLIDAMLQRQQGLAKIAVEAGVDAGTDVTGFGLAGHLLEMLSASNLFATLRLDSIPLLPGAEEMIEQGVASSLAPDNRRVSAMIHAEESVRSQSAFDLLFDPQTCGGLLLGIADAGCQGLIDACRVEGFAEPVRIGQVTQSTDSRTPLSVE